LSAVSRPSRSITFRKFRLPGELPHSFSGLHPMIAGAC
jgi:hypothetical protein